MKLKLLFVILLLSGIFIFFREPITTHVKTALILLEEFPKSPVKPLRFFTREPQHTELSFNSKHGKITADLFVPNPLFNKEKKASAVILAMGIRIKKEERPIVLHAAETLSRLGYVVLWPRLTILDRGVYLPEYPQTFLTGFSYLEKHPAVDPERISFMGFSTGSSTALVAAEDPKIASSLRSLFFFGGYFDLFDYLESIVTKESTLGQKKTLWSRDYGTIWYTQGMFKNLKAKETAKIFQTQKEEEVARILSTLPKKEDQFIHALNPKDNIKNFKAPIFILHGKNDTYVHYFESEKLVKALPSDVERTYLLTNLFKHVKPSNKISRFDFEVVSEFSKLYLFLSRFVSYL